MSAINVKKYAFSHYKYWIFMMLIWLIAFIRTAVSIDIPVFSYIGICLVAAICCTREEAVALMCSLLPLSGVFQFRLALWVISSIYIFKIKRLRVKYFTPFILMFMWELLHFSQTNVGIYGLFREFSELFALSVLLMDKEVDYSDGLPIRSLAYSTIFGTLINYIALKKLYGYDITSLTRFGKLASETSDFQGLLNPNVNSYICVIAISGLWLLRFYGKDQYKDKFFIYFLIMTIFLTQSKSALICLLIAYFLYVLFAKGRVNISIKQILSIFSTVVSFVFVFGVLLRDMLMKTLDRFFVTDISTGRVVIFSFYHQHITSSLENLICGIGLYRYTERITNIYGNIWEFFPGLATVFNGEVVYKPSHFSIQEVVVVWGIVGVLLFVYLFYMMFRHSKRKCHSLNAVTFWIILIYGLQGHLVSSDVMLLSLFYSLICLEYTALSNVGENEML